MELAEFTSTESRVWASENKTTEELVASFCCFGAKSCIGVYNTSRSRKITCGGPCLVLDWVLIYETTPPPPGVILDASYSAKQCQCRCDRVSGIFAITVLVSLLCILLDVNRSPLLHICSAAQIKALL